MSPGTRIRPRQPDRGASTESGRHEPAPADPAAHVPAAPRSGGQPQRIPQPRPDRAPAPNPERRPAPPEESNPAARRRQQNRRGPAAAEPAPLPRCPPRTTSRQRICRKAEPHTTARTASDGRRNHDSARPFTGKPANRRQPPESGTSPRASSRSRALRHNRSRNQGTGSAARCATPPPRPGNRARPGTDAPARGKADRRRSRSRPAGSRSPESGPPLPHRVHATEPDPERIQRPNRPHPVFPRRKQRHQTPPTRTTPIGPRAWATGSRRRTRDG